LQADAASGGGGTGPLKSFEPMFTKHAYFVRGFRTHAPPERPGAGFRCKLYISRR